MSSKTAEIPDHSIRICADRGGTFCDVHASYPDPTNPSGERKEHIVKLLSQDPSNYKDAPTEGIRRVLEHVTGEKIPRGKLLKTNKIDYIRLSTTIATNALLERKGEDHVLLITKGFKDLALIGNQSRPRIFDLNIRRPDVLYSEVVEIDERVTLVGYTNDPRWEERRIRFAEGEEGKIVGGEIGEGEKDGEIVRGISGEAVRVLRKPNKSSLFPTLQQLKSKGYTSISIAFVHSYTYPAHEELVAGWCKEAGFRFVSVSSKISPTSKLLPRTLAALVDAYLTPVLYRYLEGFFGGFEGGEEEFRRSLRYAGGEYDAGEDKKISENQESTGGKKQERDLRVEFMSSEGGLTPLDHFSGLKAILSGPAGGVVGYALTSYVKDGKGVIGIDIGGTSTDVSRFSGRYEILAESTLPLRSKSSNSGSGSITLSSPQLDINTVAAGGGSILSFSSGLFRTGPESAGAQPGPFCYRKGGPLTLTDANLVLGRLLVGYFPRIFGKGENEGLDEEGTKGEFEKFAGEVNRLVREGWKGKSGQAELEQEGDMSVDEVAYGFIKVANETMCRPIRAITEARGYATGDHILASFGGAGGQHACDIAQILGIDTVLIHRYSSILSAYGLALADRTYTLQTPTNTTYTSQTVSELTGQLDNLENDVRGELRRQGFEEDRIRVERMLNMRFEGTDLALMVLPEEDEADSASAEKSKGNNKNRDANEAAIESETDPYLHAFKKQYLEQFGFLLQDKAIIVDDIKVNGIGRTYGTLGRSWVEEMHELEAKEQGGLKVVYNPALDGNEDVKGDKEKKYSSTHSVYFPPPSSSPSPSSNSTSQSKQSGRISNTPGYQLSSLSIGDVVRGPAMIIDDTQTVVVIPGAEAVVLSRTLVMKVPKI